MIHHANSCFGLGEKECSSARSWIVSSTKHKRLKGFNDFATSHPLLVKEWAKENGEVQPDALPSYHYLAYWKCSACGNTYRAWTDSRANGSKCPYCTNRSVLKGFNDLATTYPDLAE